MDIALTANAPDHWCFQGQLDFYTVPKAWNLLKKPLQTAEKITLSLAEVEHSNSAALGLLLEARKLANKNGCDLELVDLPDELLALARVSNVESLLA